MSAGTDAKIDEIFALLSRPSKHSQLAVRSPVTSQEHALQSGQQALDAGADEDTVIAALLHDIGSTMPHEDSVEILRVNPGLGRRSHDAVGEAYLAGLGFPSRVTDLVGGHVSAKRYLTATHPDYMDVINDVSNSTLKAQGGPFTPEECREFEKDPKYRQKVQVRIFDDRAKVKGAETLPLEGFRSMITRVLESA